MNSYLDKVSCQLSVVSCRSIIVPIPLHPSRERERGFNQAELTARALRQILEVQLHKEAELPKLETNILVRTKNTKSQTELKDLEARAQNVKGCFAAKNLERIKGKNILLVDDVFTSGATMREAARILKKAGARKIIGFVIAKA